MKKQFEPARSMKFHVLGGILATLVLLVGAGYWGVMTNFSGAVVAPGSLVVTSNLKKVQHPTGGVVGELRVRDGDRVTAGQILARLDETVTRANLGIVSKNLIELTARQARLLAEQDGAAAIRFPDVLLLQAADADARNAVDVETRLFEMRRSARAGQKAQFQERIGQLHEQILGLKEQIVSKGRELELVDQELKGVRELWEKRLVQMARLTALERDAARLGGERGALVSSQAQTKGHITETELQIIQIDQDMRQEVGKELSEIRGRIAELVERKIAAVDQLARIDIRSPQDGVVHQLAVHTVGGVISAGEPIMMIVPERDTLDVETKINPQDIDQVHYGQKAVLRFSAFNQRTTPEVEGTLSYVSADLSTDQHSGASYYTARVAISDAEIARLGQVRLVPGMPVESFVQTTERNVLSYVTKPLADQMRRAFREGF